MSYPLQPITDRPERGGHREESHSSNSCTSEEMHYDRHGSPESCRTCPISGETSLPHLPAITPQNLIVSNGHNKKRMHSGEQDYSLCKGVSLCASDHENVTLSAKSSLSMQLSSIGSSDVFTNITTSKEDLGETSDNSNAPNDVFPTAVSSMWDLAYWRYFDEKENSQDKCMNNGTYEYCPEIKRSQFTEQEWPYKLLSVGSCSKQEAENASKFPDLASVARLRPIEIDNSSQESQPIIAPSLSKLNTPPTLASTELRENEDQEKLVDEREKHKAESLQSVSPTIASTAGNKSQTNLPGISTNGLINQTTSPLNDPHSQNNENMERPEDYNTRKNALDENEIQAVSVYSNELDPCRRGRRYKRRSYTLKELTSHFRNEMSKHCRSHIDEEEKQWFDDIVKTSLIVDNACYDSFARKPLPKIKQGKPLVSPMFEKQIEPLPRELSVHETAPKRIPLFSNSNGTTVKNSNPKHKLKYTLYPWK